MRIRLVFLCVTLFANAAFIGPAQACPVPDPMQALAERIAKRWSKDGGHPLAGTVLRGHKVWTEPGWRETACGRPGALSELSAKIVASATTAQTAVILGEVHDNAEHHWIRSEWLRTIAEQTLTAPGNPAGREVRPAVVLEQLRADQQAEIDAVLPPGSEQPAPVTLDEFKARSGWQASGWAQYPYDDILGALLRGRFAIQAGDPARDRVRNLAKDGKGDLSAGERTRLGLDRSFAETLLSASARKIEGAHCGMLPESAIPKMAAAQRFRDAHLADATLAAVTTHGSAVLLTGNSHARTDRGVPWYVRVRSPETNILSILLVEVEPGLSDAAAHVPLDPEGRPAADFVVLTPSSERGDPCDAFRTPKPAP